MKNYIITLMLLMFVALCTSCELNELDNYKAPDAGLYGDIIDDETGELVQQDIVRGSVIEIIESGYTVPQYLIFKNDGTYANTRLFSNTYSVQPVRGNFKVVEPQQVDIHGQTKLDFRVTPYIRIKDPQITRTGDMIKATFRLEQTSVSNVLKVGLYAHRDPHVGQTMQLAKQEININAVVDPSEVYTIELDIFSDADLFSNEGKTLFFRIGALIDVPEAKYNYAPAVGLKL
jgi:hypothetical protein